jgi:hypothetical protein
VAWRRKQPAVSYPSSPRDDASSWWKWFAIFATFAGLAAAGSGLIGDPVMAIDAHVIWAIKAKAFFLADSFSPLAARCCSKASYPVLFPLQTWWIYQHLRHVNDWWHQALGFLFLVDIVILTFAACRVNTRTAWAWTAAAVVATNPIQVLVVTRGFADSALAAYFLGSAVCLAAYLSNRDESARPVALLLLLGALQTKNEGLAWTTFAIALIALTEVHWKLYRRAASTVALYVIAMAPWMIYKRSTRMAYAPEEAFASLHTLRHDWLLRVKTVVIAHVTDFQPSGFLFLMLLCLPLIWLSWKRISRPALALILAQFLSYVVIYLVVQDQRYQLTGFLDRGINHISPALICICVIAYQLSTPQAKPGHDSIPIEASTSQKEFAG